MNSKECNLCGESFVPDGYMRKLCESCRDDGYRKTKRPGEHIRTLVGRARPASLQLR